MSDSHEATARDLLPCLYPLNPCPESWPWDYMCMACVKRPAVALALAAAEARGADQFVVECNGKCAKDKAR